MLKYNEMAMFVYNENFFQCGECDFVIEVGRWLSKHYSQKFVEKVMTILMEFPIRQFRDEKNVIKVFEMSQKMFLKLWKFVDEISFEKNGFGIIPIPNQTQSLQK